MGGEMSKGNYGKIGQLEECGWIDNYKDACKTDRDVKFFHKKLEGDVEKIMNTIENGSAESMLSMDWLMMTTSYMAESDAHLKNLILKNPKDIWKDGKLRGLVKLYSQINVVNKNFYKKLNKCLSTMSRNQSLLLAALECLGPANATPGKAQYAKCRGKLLEFKAAENPFNKDFSNLLKSVLQQNNQILEQLKGKYKELDIKYKFVRLGKRISFILFATVGASLFISSLAGALLLSGPLAVSIAPISSAIFGPSFTWLFSRLKKYENRIRTEREVTSIMMKRVGEGFLELKDIGYTVDTMKDRIVDVLKSIDFYCTDEVHQKVAVEDIKRDNPRFNDQMNALKAAVDKVRIKQRSIKSQIHRISLHVDLCIKDLQSNSTQVRLHNTGN